MGRSSRVTSQDAEQLIRLAGELLELPPDVAMRRKHQGDALARLLGARFVALSDVLGLQPGGDLQIVSHVFGGEPLNNYGNWVQRYAEAYADADPVLEAVRKRRAELLVAGRPALIPNGAWKMTPVRNELLMPAGVDEFMLLQVAVDEQRDITFSIHRDKGQPPFGRREEKLLELVGLQCRHLHPWLYPPAPPSLDQLPPRLREVLGYLVAGKTEPEIAALIRRSPHTVHDHVRRLYRLLGVSNRVDLLRAYELLIGKSAQNPPEQAGESPSALG